MNAAVIPESIAQLQLQLNQIRSTQPRGKKLPDSVWQAAVELAREHGVYSVAHHLRLDWRHAVISPSAQTRAPACREGRALRRIRRPSALVGSGASATPRSSTLPYRCINPKLTAPAEFPMSKIDTALSSLWCPVL
jgi:hypothetical protein